MPIYWISNEIEPWIILFNNSDNQSERDTIFEEHLKIPLEKLVENVSNTFRMDYMDDIPQRVQDDVLSFAVSKLYMVDPVKCAGKSFGYITLIVKNYLIQLNNRNYNRWNKEDSIDKNDSSSSDDEHVTPLQLVAKDTIHEDNERSEFVKLLLNWFDKHLAELFPNTITSLLRIQIAKTLLQCFTEYPDSLLESGTDAYNTLRDKDNSKLIVQHVCNILKLPHKDRRHIVIVKRRLAPHIKRLYLNYIATGEIEPMPERKPQTTAVIRKISWDSNGVKHITKSIGPTIQQQIKQDNKKTRNHLTEKQIVDIRTKYSNEKMNIQQLARECGVHKSIIRRIIKCTTYKDLMPTDGGYTKEEIEQRWKENPYNYYEYSPKEQHIAVPIMEIS